MYRQLPSQGVKLETRTRNHSSGSVSDGIVAVNTAERSWQQGKQYPENEAENPME